MRRILLLIVFYSICGFVLASSENYKKVKIFVETPGEIKNLVNIGLQFDHYSIEKDKSIITFISHSDFIKLKNSSFRYEILIDNWNEHYANRAKMTGPEIQNQLKQTARKFGVTNFDFGSMGGYYTLEEVYKKLDTMVVLFPDLITTRESIGKSNEGRDIYFVKISNNPDSDEAEPEVLYTALHHAREPESMMQMIYFMFYLLENYGTDPEVTYLIENRELYFIPVVNPDGYKYNEIIQPNGGGMWRKNKRDNNQNGSFSESVDGVDLNRNYGPIEYWDSPKGGSSTIYGDETYRGSAPFSEPETDAIRNFLTGREIKACLNYHTFSNLLIYPYGALGKETPDSVIFREFARDMTEFNNYTYGTDVQTVGYNTRGNSDDFMYDGDLENTGKIFTMTPEVGSGSDGFWPNQNRIVPLAEENIYPNLYYAWIVGEYIKANDLHIDNVYINSGDSVQAFFSIDNKGLSAAQNIIININVNSEKHSLYDDQIMIDQLASRQSYLIGTGKFYLPGYLEVLDTIQITITARNDFGINYSASNKSFVIGTPIFVFSDSANVLEDNWFVVTNGTKKWDVTQSYYNSSPSSFTDSKYGNYLPNTSAELNQKNVINLTGIQNPVLSFWTRFEIENDYDYGQVLVSTNEGSSFTPVGGKYSNPGTGNFQPFGQPVYDGRQNEWVKEEIDLENFSGKLLLIKFALVSDQYIEMDGWYIDDISVGYYPVTGVEDYYIDDYELFQNYPNPFNPTTIIKFSIPTVGDAFNASSTCVSLKIFDILGREIAALVNEPKPPGTYEVEFNIKGLTSGIYFYRLQAGNFTSAKKMILMR